MEVIDRQLHEPGSGDDSLDGRPMLRHLTVMRLIRPLQKWVVETVQQEMHTVMGNTLQIKKHSILDVVACCQVLDPVHTERRHAGRVGFCGETS